MYITGSFVNQQGDTVTVHIVTSADRSEVLEIGTESSGLYFTDDPAETVSEVNDTFDHLLRQSATIRLLARNFIPDFFSTSCRNAVVNIYKGDTCIFAGFIEPLVKDAPSPETAEEAQVQAGQESARQDSSTGQDSTSQNPTGHDSTSLDSGDKDGKEPEEDIQFTLF